MRRAVIIGAGIAGPVAAMALQKAGIAATIYEAHDAPARTVGSFLTVATNGLTSLRAIAAHACVLAAGFPTQTTVMYSGTGKRLGEVAIGSAQTKGFESRTIKRAHLHRALLEEAGSRGIAIHYGKRLVQAEVTPDGADIRFADGAREVADIMVGCDGVHSATRTLIDPAAPSPRYVGLLNFGGYTPAFAAGKPGAWHMIFGKHAFFGFTPDPYGGTVWFANVPREPATHDERRMKSVGDWQRLLLELFAEDRGLATDVIANGHLELSADNTHDLPSVPVWHRGAAIIIGDAAHAPAPTSGQGASMAIEDAVVLGKCLRDAPTTRAAFEAFERLRRSRVERIVAHGARGSSGKTVGPAARWLRDLMLPFVFQHLVTPTSLAWMYDYQIGWDSAASAPI